MAIIWFEHFDLYGTDANALRARGYTYGGIPVLTTSSRTGTYGLRLPSANDVIRKPLTEQLDIVGTGAAMFIESAAWNDGNSQNGFVIGDTASIIERVVVCYQPTDASLAVFVSNIEVGSSVPGAIIFGTWMWIEVKVIRNTGGANTGTVEVKVNGVTVINVTNADLPNAFTSAGLGNPRNTNRSAVRYDDWVVWDTSGDINNDFIGDTFIFIAPPEADGTPSDWVPTPPGTRFSTIDDAVPSESDFITAPAIGNINEFTHAALNLPEGAVAAIGVQTRGFKTQSGQSMVQVGIASGGQVDLSDDFALGTGVTSQTHISNLDPSTGLPWTQSSAQASRLRIVRTG